MAIELTGGCTVSGLREGAAASEGEVRIWQHAGRAQGAAAISLRVLELPQGRSLVGGSACDEVLYVLDGAGKLGERELEADTGIYLAPNVRASIECPRPMTLVSSRCPDPDEPAGHSEGSAAGARPPSAGGQAASAAGRRGAVVAESAPVVVRLSDCISEMTGDRWYRVLLDHHIGNSRVTQFVGSIPPGRAPDHYHEYEEVLCILAGRGRMWAGDKSTPIERGSCVYLPRRQVHCVENTGDSELRLLGVFHPSGSPAVRYAAP
ncbi:MAG TPA: cupin domain-containing protein [Myxococcales bacterium]